MNGTTETETKYYSGPTGRFAMRVEGTLYWIFSDHLQSSSVILDEVGNVISRTDYTAFGEMRAETGTSPTDYQYTGQRSYLDSFGLHYYVARWYDPVTAHFAQADSIIPQPGNSGDWNRYAYVLYNPMRYTDPSGHAPCFEDGYCPIIGATEDDLFDGWFGYYGISITGNWKSSDKWAILFGVQAVAKAFTDVVGFGDPNSVFINVFGSLDFVLNSGDKDGRWYCESSLDGFSCDPDARANIDSRLVVHELGHTFNNIIAMAGRLTPYEDLLKASIRDNSGNWVTGINDVGSWVRGYGGYISRGKPDLYHGPMNWADAATATVNEEFADMFMNWIFNSFDYRPLANGSGAARYNWMTANMAEWLGRSWK